MFTIFEFRKSIWKMFLVLFYTVSYKLKVRERCNVGVFERAHFLLLSPYFRAPWQSQCPVRSRWLLPCFSSCTTWRNRGKARLIPRSFSISFARSKFISNMTTSWETATHTLAVHGNLVLRFYCLHNLRACGLVCRSLGSHLLCAAFLPVAVTTWTSQTQVAPGPCWIPFYA